MVVFLEKMKPWGKGKSVNGQRSLLLTLMKSDSQSCLFAADILFHDWLRMLIQHKGENKYFKSHVTWSHIKMKFESWIKTVDCEDSESFKTLCFPGIQNHGPIGKIKNNIGSDLLSRKKSLNEYFLGLLSLIEAPSKQNVTWATWPLNKDIFAKFATAEFQ